VCVAIVAIHRVHHWAGERDICRTRVDPCFQPLAGLASRHVIPAGMEHTQKTCNRGRTRADLLPGTSALPTILLTRFFFLFRFFHEPPADFVLQHLVLLGISSGLVFWPPVRWGELVDWGASNGFFYLFVVGRSQCNQRIFLLNSIGWC
jgi:hypothetical protein